MKVDFYQLTGFSVEAVLPRIAERVLGEGGRLLVVVQDDALADLLDRSLWTWKADSFLPHGRRGKGDEAAQAILIGDSCDALNCARNVALADGVWRDEALAFDRAFLFFGPERLEDARDAWRALGNRDEIERRFWKQDEAGRWSQAA